MQIKHNIPSATHNSTDKRSMMMSNKCNEIDRQSVNFSWGIRNENIVD